METSASSSSVVAAAATTPQLREQAPPPLLREWSYTENDTNTNNSSSTNNNHHQEENNNNADNNNNDENDDEKGPSLVPVAPAVVLPIGSSELRESDKGAASRYPVATYVSNLVRSGIDSIAATAAAYAVEETTTAQQSQEQPHSVRSESVVRAVADHHHHIHDTLRSVESEADIPTLEGADFVIVDGDLVAIPAAHHHHASDDDDEEDDEDRQGGGRNHYNRRRNHGSNNKTRQRLKGIRKWIKKRASRMVMENDKQSKKKNKKRQQQQRIEPSSQQLEEDQQQQQQYVHHHSHRPQSNQPQQMTMTSLNEDLVSRELSIATTSDLHEYPAAPTSPARRRPSSLETDSCSVASIPQISIVPLPLRVDQAVSGGSAVNADFIGNVEEVAESGVVTNLASAVAFVEHDFKDDDYYYKKDDTVKQEEMVLDSMLQQARHESTSSSEEEPEIEGGGVTSSLKRAPQAKMDVDSKPLSEATTLDKHVWNDTLKVVLVGGDADEKSNLGRTLAGKRPKRPKHSLGVDVHTWTPDLKFSIWDIHSVYAGAHPATQSLFFSANALYVVLWDLGGSHNIGMARERLQSLDYDYYNENDDDDDDEDDNEFAQEEMERAVDRALELDIQDKVLSWLDHTLYAGSAILPVVTISDQHCLEPSEIQRRCSLLQMLLMKHPAFEGEGAPHLIFGNNDSILRVGLESGEGIPELQEMIHAIGKEKVFPHIGTTVDPAIVEVNQTIRRLKKDHKVILLDHLMSEMKTRMDVEQVQFALHYLCNIGEVLYYGNSTDEILSRYVILSRKWLVSALSCILRPDLQRELDETRRFMNLQCVYSGEAFSEGDVVQTLLQGTNSSCPILSAKDSAMLWQSMSFMREAADRTAQLSEASNTMYDFLERLLVYTGILMPLTVSAEPTYFVPSLLDSAATAGVWTYKSSESWMTTLCHSWLLRDGAPSNIMEHVTTCLLQDLYEFSHEFHGALVKSLHNPKTYPMGSHSMSEFMNSHDNEAIGRIKIHQVVCWKSCMLVKIGTVFADADHSELRESFSEIFVALVDEQSDYCVSTRDMSNSMKRLIVCGKGQVGHHGRKLWKGGYSLVLESIRASLADTTGIRREVVCPECLAHSHPSVAGTWSWDAVQLANETGNAGVRCTRGHLVDTNLLCGKCIVTPKPRPTPPRDDELRPQKGISELLRSTVVVGLWDCDTQQICSVGSGFIVDKKLGLVVTASHILFDMAPGRKFGSPYFGIPNAKAVIGVIQGEVGHTAVFRYFADIVAYDVRNVDACVLRITSRLEHDVDGQDCGSEAELPLANTKNEKLQPLKMTRTFELEQSVRILGFNQGGEGVLEQGKHVNRSADFAKGYICKLFTNMGGSDDSSTSSKGSSSSQLLKDPPAPPPSFSPREEIVVMCPTISGHSGGPCVNDDGRVVGILSRADPVDRQRCYLVPTTEIKELVNQAKHAASAAPPAATALFTRPLPTLGGRFETL